MDSIESIFEKLFNFFNVSTIIDLSDKINVPYGTLSKWKSRNSINAIKKKCRELGIYNEIFGGSSQKIETTNESESVKKDNDLSLKFDVEITAILYTASTVVNANNKDSLVKLIKEWIVKNI